MTDGRILVVGGSSSPSCGTFTPQVWVDIYNPSNDTWVQGQDLPGPRASHAAALVSSTQVMVTGGQSAPNGSNPAYLATTVIFNSTGNVWSSGPTMNNGHRYHGMANMGAGSSTDVLVFGGLSGDGSSPDAAGPYGTTERWGGGSSWVIASGMIQPRQWNNSVGWAVLPNGNILAALGNTAGPALDTAEIFDSQSGLWSSAGTLLGGPRGSALAVVSLGNSGRAIAIGGLVANVGPSSAVDLYTPPPLSDDGGADASYGDDGGTGGGVADGGDAEPDAGTNPDAAADRTFDTSSTDAVADTPVPDAIAPDAVLRDTAGPEVTPTDAPSSDASVLDARAPDASAPDVVPPPRIDGSSDARFDSDARSDVGQDSSDLAPVEVAGGGGCDCRTSGAPVNRTGSNISFGALAFVGALRRIRRRRRLSNDHAP
jgi:hypothetical protein